MAALRFYLFLAALCSCSTLGFGDITSPLPVTIDVAPVSSTPVADAPKPTEPDTTTSSTTSTTSTTTTTTTTEAPTTTTSTTTTTTTTTTPAPPAPTPAPKPKPVPAPDQGTWMFTANNVTCIVAQFAAQITIKYSQSLQNKTSIANMTMNVPANASVLAGSCNETDGLQWMQLGWLAAETNAPNTIVMVFVKNDTTKTYKLHTFNLTIDASQLVNSSVKTDAIVLSHGEEWATPLATSYRCMTATHLKMSNDTFNVSANVAVSSLQEEAFRTAPGKGFSAARDCGGGDVPDAVPIAVGCALGGLVLVVLAAYLVARRRSAARGYLSM